MKIAVLKENNPNEKRVALVPEVVKKFTKAGIDVCIEKNAGLSANFSNQEYIDAGASVSNLPLEILSDANILVKIHNYDGTENKFDELEFLREETIIIGTLSPFNNEELFKRYNQRNITSFSLDFIPRITRAQSMDVLSSQSNLAGYRAVIDASYHYDKSFPMMMTAAGTVKPAKVLVIGVGVAGLQAIATAKRLGAIVSAYDVRPSTKEQVESLGANFLTFTSTESGEGSGGYAKEMSNNFQKEQEDFLSSVIAKHDVIITTALIPGKKAPLLITKEMVESMREGSVIVDLAASAGGNCQVTQVDQISNYQNKTIIGKVNYLSEIAHEASKLYATNLFNFINLLINNEKKEFQINLEDEILKESIITLQGKTVNNRLVTGKENEK